MGREVVSYQKWVWGLCVHSGERGAVTQECGPHCLWFVEYLSFWLTCHKVENQHIPVVGTLCHLASVVTYGVTAVESYQSRLLNRVREQQLKCFLSGQSS